MSWPTGNSISTEWVAIRFLIPNTPWLMETLTGALYSLTRHQVWDAVGDVDPLIAAAAFRVIWNSVMVQAMTVGQIVCFPAHNMEYIGQEPLNGPSQWRKCDGATYNKSDYPALYGVIGDTFGATLTTFNIPDLRGRTVVDAGHGSGLSLRVLGDTLGEESHTLSSGEMPAHSHTEGSAVSTLINGGLEAPASAAVPVASVTGSTGGGGAHENMQPSLVLVYYIQVEP